MRRVSYAVCHPERRMVAKEYCNACYQKARLQDPAKRESALQSVRDWRKNNKEHQNALQRKWRAENPDKRFAQDLKYKYGLTVERWSELVNKYEGACWICKKVPETYLCVDHCHTSGKIRGLLCTSCNAGVGQFQDSIELLDKAKTYLTENG